MDDDATREWIGDARIGRARAERFGATLEVGSALSLEEGFGVVAVGLSAGGGGPLVAALTVAVLAAPLRRWAGNADPTNAIAAFGDALEGADRVLAHLAATGRVVDEEAADALAAQGFSVPGRTESSAVLRGPLAASAAIIGWTARGVVTAHVGDAAVWRAREGQWERVGHPDTLGQSWGASVPTGWEAEVTRALGPGVGERGEVAVADVRVGDAWAIIAGAGEHLRKTSRRGIGARVRVDVEAP